MVEHLGGEDPIKPKVPVDSLAKTVKRLEARVEAVEKQLAKISSAPVDAPSRSDLQETSAPESTTETLHEQSPPESEPRLSVSLGLVLSIAGQVCLVLCGAFLLRALTNMEILPVKVGLLLGVAYALGWLVLTDFLGRGGQVLKATFFGASAAVIAYPLIWEAVQKYEVVAGNGSAAAMALVTAVALGVAWRRDLVVLAWIITVAAIAACFSLTVTLHQPEPYTGVLLLLGVATTWISYNRDWVGIHWITAIAVDVIILQITFMASRPDGPPASYTDLSSTAVLVLSLAFLLVYLASFSAQTLLRKRDVSIFEIVQTGAVLLIGLGGAVRVAEAMGMGTSLIAGGVLLVALTAYAVAFSQTKLRWEHRKNFMFYAWLAFVLALAGCHLAAQGLAVLVACSALAISGAVLGGRFRRVTLHYHSAGFLIAAAYSSGLTVWALENFVLPASESWPELTLSRIIVLATAVACYVVVVLATVDPRRPRSSRIPRLIIAIVAVVGCGGALVQTAVNTIGNTATEVSPALVATIRTVILSTATITLAALGRKAVLLELRWTVYPLLLFGGLKLVLEDLRQSTPEALFVAFGVYGLSLIVSPRLIRGKPV